MQPAPITVGGQCEGYGGLYLALSALLPVEHAWYAEIEPAAAAILDHRFPGIPNLGDITAVDWASADSVDILTSGFPCQPFSSAGQRAGSDDERHLWPTGVLPAITAQLPLLVVLENVTGLLTIEQGSVFGRILADLDALDYRVSWTTVGACRVGACHHRHRVFIAATRAPVDTPASEPVGYRQGLTWRRPAHDLFGDARPVKWPAAGFTADGLAWQLPGDVCGKNGIALFPTPTATPYGTNRSPSAGAAVRPSLEGIVRDLLPTPRANDSAGRQTHADWRPALPGVVLDLLPTPRASDTGTSGRRPGKGWRPPLSAVVLDLLPTPRARDYKTAEPADARAVRMARGTHGGPALPDAVIMLPPGGTTTGDVADYARWGKYAAAVLRHEYVYRLQVPEPIEPRPNGKPQMRPHLPEWMQGLPAGWVTDVVPRTPALKAIGNGVNPRQAAYGLHTLPTVHAAAAVLLARSAARP